MKRVAQLAFSVASCGPVWAIMPCTVSSELVDYLVWGPGLYLALFGLTVIWRSCARLSEGSNREIWWGRLFVCGLGSVVLMPLVLLMDAQICGIIKSLLANLSGGPSQLVGVSGLIFDVVAGCSGVLLALVSVKLLPTVRTLDAGSATGFSSETGA